MGLTTQSGLVAGVSGPDQTVSVELLKAICIAGKRIEPGVVELPKQLASMLVGANKARKVEEPPAPPPKPPEVMSDGDPPPPTQPPRRSGRG